MDPRALTCTTCGSGKSPEGLDPYATSWRLRNSLDESGSGPWPEAWMVLMLRPKEEREWCFGETLVLWGGWSESGGKER